MDVNGGQYPNPNGSPIWPGATSTGPLLAGNVIHSDGTGNLAGVGEQQGTANVGYAEMAQVEVVTQAGVAASGIYTTSIVIPAQSQITGMQLMNTTPWTGSVKVFDISDTAGGFYAIDVDATTAGLIVITPGTDATRMGNWDNVGATDVRLVLTSDNTGNGIGTFLVRYLQGVNLAS